MSTGSWDGSQGEIAAGECRSSAMRVGKSQPWILHPPVDPDLKQENDGGGQMGTWTPGPGDGDTFTGDATAETADGGMGRDILRGAGGDDTLYGGDGDDLVLGDLNSAAVIGNDTLHGEAGNDVIFGGRGDDLIYGGAGDDVLFNGVGDASSWPWYYSSYGYRSEGIDAGVDTIDGGEGVDTAILNFIDRSASISFFLDTPSTVSQILIGGVAAGGVTGVERFELYGGSGADTITGGYWIEGRDGDDALTAVTGAWLFGGDGADTLVGGAEADLIEGGAGADHLSGGGGVDHLRYNSSVAGVIVDLAANTASGGDAQGDAISGFENVDGSRTGANTLRGADGDNELSGGAANDTLEGRGGNDDLYAGAGADTMIGGDGHDAMYVDDAGDVVIEMPSQGIDWVILAVIDTYVLPDNVEYLEYGYADSHSVTLTGNALDNILRSSSGADVIEGLAGDDAIEGGAGDDVLKGGDGDDRLVGDTGDDSLRGGDGNDALYGFTGLNTMYGGAGDDTFIVDNEGDIVIELSGEGFDQILATVSFVLPAEVEDLLLSETAVSATGNSVANTLVGTASANMLDGRGGADTLYGFGGDDMLSGGAGADTMIGGGGNDIYVVNTAADVITESPSMGGKDLVQSSVTHVLGANLENLTLAGVGLINGTGNTRANVITGNGAANILSGGGGGDTLNGGAGDDIMTGGAGADKFVFNATVVAANSDTITDFTHNSDKLLLENSLFTALGAATGTLAAAKFWVGANAHDASDRIIYNAATGALFYDANGNGAGQKVLIASLDAGLTITASDFQVI